MHIVMDRGSGDFPQMMSYFQVAEKVETTFVPQTSGFRLEESPINHTTGYVTEKHIPSQALSRENTLFEKIISRVYNNTSTNGNFSDIYPAQYTQLYNGKFITTVSIVACSVGVILGVIIASVFFTQLTKRRRGAGRRRSQTIKSNPTEQTFEPLDLSLTLPSYARNFEDRKPVKAFPRTSTAENDFKEQYDKARNYLDKCRASSYHGYDAPSPPTTAPRITKGVCRDYSHIQKMKKLSTKSFNSRFYKSRFGDNSAVKRFDSFCSSKYKRYSNGESFQIEQSLETRHQSIDSCNQNSRVRCNKVINVGTYGIHVGMYQTRKESESTFCNSYFLPNKGQDNVINL